MNEQRMRFQVGLFVFAALGILAILITIFGGAPTLFKRQNHYTVLFENAMGISAGTPVQKSGVRIGAVAGVRLDEETEGVRVDILVDKKFVLHLGDQARLVRGLLGGDLSIDFVGARRQGEEPDLSPAPPDHEFIGMHAASVQTVIENTTKLMPGAEATIAQIDVSLKKLDRLEPTIDEALREFRDLAKTARESIPDLRRTNEELLVTSRNWGKLGERLDVLVQTNQDKLVKSIDSLNDALGRITKLFNDENQRNLSISLKNVRSGSESLESITKSTDAILKEAQQTIKRVNDTVKQADDVLENIQKATKPMAERSASVMKNLDESTAQINRLTGEARELLHGVTRGDNTLRSLLSDPALYNNLNDAACMMTRIMPRVDRALRDFEVFADKIARHPEALGIGGAVKPGSGLK